MDDRHLLSVNLNRLCHTHTIENLQNAYDCCCKMKRYWKKGAHIPSNVKNKLRIFLNKV